MRRVFSTYYHNAPLAFNSGLAQLYTSGNKSLWIGGIFSLSSYGAYRSVLALSDYQSIQYWTIGLQTFSAGLMSFIMYQSFKFMNCNVYKLCLEENGENLMVSTILKKYYIPISEISILTAADLNYNRVTSFAHNKKSFIIAVSQ